MIRADGLPSITRDAGSKKIVVGYDGFVDTIVRPVKKAATKSEPEEFFDTIEEFGTYLVGKAKKSCSIELHVESRSPGGNMPSLAAGAAALGLDVTCIGMLGEDGKVEDTFTDLPCRLYPFAPPGASTCMEFRDGKVFFAPGCKISGNVWDKVEQATDGRAADWIQEADLLALVNWSELPFSQKLWEQTYFHAFGTATRDKEKIVFFDLCDITRKGQDEVEGIVKLMRCFSEKRKTILSLNENEAVIMCQRLGWEQANLEQTGENLHNIYGIDEILIHTLHESILVAEGGIFHKETIFIEHPKRSTGAGDHFNAASCFAAVMGLDEEERLIFANKYVSLYVKTGKTPGVQDWIKNSDMF